MKRIASTVIAASCILGARAGDECVAVSGVMELDGGFRTPLVTLKNGLMSAKFLPELGGKIISLSDHGGREYLDRGAKPYVRRHPEMSFNDTEFDGVDEIFPSLGECVIPSGDFEGLKISRHGDLFKRAWKFSTGNGTVEMEAKGFDLPCVFSRRASLSGAKLLLEYSLSNESKKEIPYIYTFHPLFKAFKGSRLDLPPGTKVETCFSRGNWMGRPGNSSELGSIRREDGALFLEDMFRADSGGYWKFFTERMEKGEVSLLHPDKSGIRLEWPATQMPFLAVWCSEGNVNGQNHIAPEPSASSAESLDKAIARGEAKVLPPNGVHEWRIEISVIEPQGP